MSVDRVALGFGVYTEAVSLHLSMRKVSCRLQRWPCPGRISLTVHWLTDLGALVLWSLQNNKMLPKLEGNVWRQEKHLLSCRDFIGRKQLWNITWFGLSKWFIPQQLKQFWDYQSGHAVLHQGLANIFCNGPESKYFRFCGPNYSILLLEQT